MSKWSENAKKSIERSRVIDGREKVSIDEVIKNYPNGVCIDEFEILTNEEGKDYVVLHIKGPNNYFNGGSIALKIARGWTDDFDGDDDVASAELAKDGGCTFIIKRGKTKKGNNITLFDPID